MKIATAKNVTEAEGVIEEARATVFHDDIKVFQVLSSNLYSNKIESIVREISCNGYDANREVNATEPLQITVPNRMNLLWECRDYGPGMSREDVMRIYLGYFHSTKDQDNKAVGGYGLGSKSPFAYCDAFTVTSWHGGFKRIYAMTFDRASAPAVRLVSEEKSGEPSGLSVAVPVQPEDIDAWVSATMRTCWRFDPQPVIKGSNNFQWPKVEYTEQGKGWRYYRRSSSGTHKDNMSGFAMAIIGPVAYQIPTNNFDNLTRLQKDILQSPIEFDFAIGALDITPSREALQFTERTKKTILTRVDIFANELMPKINTQFDKCANMYEAIQLKVKKREELRYDRGIMSSLLGQAKYKGEEIKDNYVLEVGKIPVGTFTEIRTVPRYAFDTTKPQFTILAVDDPNLLIDVDVSRDDYAVVWDDLADRRIMARLKHAQTNRCYMVVFRGGQAAYNAIKAWLPEGYPILKSSDMADPPSNRFRDAVGARIVPVMKYTGGFRQQGWDACNVDVNSGGIFVDINRYELVMPNGVTRNHYAPLYQALKNLQLLKPDEVLYGVPATYKGTLKDGEDGWKNLWTLLNERLTDSVKADLLAKAKADLDRNYTKHMVQAYANKYGTFIKRHKITLTKLVPDLIYAYDSLDNAKGYDVYDDYLRLAAFGLVDRSLVDKYEPNVTNKAVDTYVKFEKDFPFVAALYGHDLRSYDVAVIQYIEHMQELYSLRAKTTKAQPATAAA